MHYSGQTGQDAIKALDLVKLKKIVNEFGLHTNYPASPMPIYRKLGTKLARKNLPKNRPAYCGWHPTYNRTFAIFDNSLIGLDLNHALWHELSHLLFDNYGQKYFLNFESKYLYQKNEMLCELRAAYLAVPFDEMMQLYRDGLYDSQVAGSLKVPIHYLQLCYEIHSFKENK